MRLSNKQLNNLKTLLKGASVAWSSLGSDLRETLIDEEQVNIITHGSHKSLLAQSPASLQTFLEQHYEELRGFDWNLEVISTPLSRSELAAISGNSKTQTIRTCPGFLVNSYIPIPAKLGAKDIVILPEEGTMLFVADWKIFSIPNDVVVVGVENMENFRLIRKQKYLFPLSSILFVSRYPQSADLRNWLMQIPNPYLHFGDFDLAGLRIYETEFYKYLSNRASFFIPEDIEIRLKNGSAERYNNQYEKLKNYIPTDNRLLPLYNLLHKYHRCYDQEGYIINSEV